MHDRLTMTLQDNLTNRIVKTGVKGVLIEISSREIVDYFMGRLLNNIATISRILDAETVVVGMQTAVATAIVEEGLSLTKVRTALSVEKGMIRLQKSLSLSPDDKA
jgi:rsbT antagonist protein RsbS